jgi:hypothetical protein
VDGPALIGNGEPDRPAHLPEQFFHHCNRSASTIFET